MNTHDLLRIKTFLDGRLVGVFFCSGGAGISSAYTGMNKELAGDKVGNTCGLLEV
jgi:hypothetical protein